MKHLPNDIDRAIDAALLKDIKPLVRLENGVEVPCMCIHHQNCDHECPACAFFNDCLMSITVAELEAWGDDSQKGAS